MIWRTVGKLAVAVAHFAWFDVVWTLLVLMLMWMLSAYGSFRLRRYTQDLETRVQQRTSELVESNLQLYAAQESLQRQNEEMREAQEYLARANARLEALATTDGMTGLCNHRTFHEHLDREWARSTRYGTSLSIVLIDIDHFKQYNDSFGHPAGDEVLRSIGAILKATARESDIVARYGGEEFVIVTPETESGKARQLAERVRVAIESANWPNRPITGSFGIASVGLTTQSARQLIDQADAALYRSKRDGRNRITHYSDPGPTEAKAA